MVLVGELSASASDDVPIVAAVVYAFLDYVFCAVSWTDLDSC